MARRCLRKAGQSTAKRRPIRLNARMRQGKRSHLTTIARSISQKRSNPRSCRRPSDPATPRPEHARRECGRNLVEVAHCLDARRNEWHQRQHRWSDRCYRKRTFSPTSDSCFVKLILTDYVTAASVGKSPPLRPTSFLRGAHAPIPDINYSVLLHLIKACYVGWQHRR